MNEELENIKLLRLKDVLKIFPVSPSHWFQGVKDGKFPQGKKLSERITMWRYQDIKALIDSVD